MADLTDEQLYTTIFKKSYIKYLQDPGEHAVINAEFENDAFFNSNDPTVTKPTPIEFLVDTLDKVYDDKSMELEERDKEQLEQMLVYTVLHHNEHEKMMAALEEDERRAKEKELQEKFQASLVEYNKNHPSMSDRFTKLHNNIEKIIDVSDIKSKLPNFQNIQDIASEKGAKVKAALSDAADFAKGKASSAADFAKGKLGKFTSMFGTPSTEEPPATEGGKRKSKKNKSKKGGKSKKNKSKKGGKSKKNKSKKSKKSKK